jgi:hypothetical protein
MIVAGTARPDSAAQPASVQLAAQFACARQFLHDQLAFAVERYGAAALDVIDLPNLASPAGEVSPAQVRAAGALLWAREMEATGLLAFVDALADGVAEGKLLLPIVAGGDRLMMYRQVRRDGFAAQERQALYARVFDREPFVGAFRRLLDALDTWGRAPRVQAPSPVAIQMVAREVATELSLQAAGMVNFAARTIVQQLHQAATVLLDPEVRHALGGGSLWQVIRLHAPHVLGRPLSPEPHAERASAALSLTRWLADAARLASTAAYAPAPEAIAAAQRWLAAGEGA